MHDTQVVLLVDDGYAVPRTDIGKDWRNRVSVTLELTVEKASEARVFCGVLALGATDWY
jgi:hypothetical protein